MASSPYGKVTISDEKLDQFPIDRAEGNSEMT